MRHAQWLVPVMVATIAACAPRRQDAQQAQPQRDIVQVEEGPTLICVDRDNGRTYVDCGEPGCTGFDEHPEAFTDEMIVDVLDSHRRRHRRLAADRLPELSSARRFLIFVGVEHKPDAAPPCPPPPLDTPNLAQPWDQHAHRYVPHFDPLDVWRMSFDSLDFTAFPGGAPEILHTPAPPVPSADGPAQSLSLLR